MSDPKRNGKFDYQVSTIEKKKAPVVAFPFVGDSIGGSYVSAMLLIRALLDEGCMVKIYVHHSGLLTDWFTRRNIRFEIVQPLISEKILKIPGGKTYQMCAFLFSALWRISRDKVTVVHGNDSRIHRTWLLLTKIMGRRYIWHQRTRYYESRRFNALIPAADRVVAISDYVRSTLPDSIRSNVLVVQNPVASRDEDGFQEAQPEDRSCFRLVCVGALKKQKRVTDAILLLRELRQSFGWNPSLVLYVKADEFSLTDLRKMAEKLDVEPQVEIREFSESFHHELPKFDVAVCPAENEGSGRVLLEAMSAGVVVVASRSGGHTELISHRKTGFLFDLGDVAGCGELVYQIYRRGSDYREIRSAALTYLRRNHSIAQHSNEMMGIYGSVCTK